MKTSPEIKKPHGGKRPGAGRKARDPDGISIVSVRLTGEEKAAFDMLGGIHWLRQYLNSITNPN